MRDCQLGHDNPADFRACMHLILLQLYFVASVGLATMDGSFEQGEESGQLRLLAALVEIFKQCQDVFIS